MTDLDTTFDVEYQTGEDFEGWARRFYTCALLSGRVFRTTDGNLLVQHDGGPPIRVTDPSLFQRHLAPIVKSIRYRNVDGEHVARPCVLDRAQLNMLFGGPAADVLPLVTAVVFDPVVVPQGDGRYAMVAPGFNRGNGVYYYVPSGEPPITPVEGTYHLQRCFSAIPFENPGCFANLVAWLLGGVCLDPKIDPPLFVVSGNQQKVGKSSVIRAAGTIITGVNPNPIASQGSEFLKQLSAQFLENSRFVFLDNIVVRGGGSFDNQQLSTLLTQGFSKKIRILGHSRHVSAAGVMVAASLNDAKFVGDLATRILGCSLCAWEDRIHNPYCVHYATEHRRDLYGELLNMAITGVNDPIDDEHHKTLRFRSWLQFVRPRVEPLFGTLAISEAGMFDDITQEIYHLGLDSQRIFQGVPFHGHEFVDKIRANAARYPALYNRFDSLASDRAREVVAGHILSSRADKPLCLAGPDITVTLRSATDRHTKTLSYYFEVSEPKKDQP